MKTTVIDGKTYCLKSESGEQTLWGECPAAAPLQMSAVNPQLDVDALSGGLFVVAGGCLLFLWAGSIAESRRRRYRHLITSVKRGMKS